MIHYHGTPITGGYLPSLMLLRRHAMVSYAHPEQIDIVAEVCQSFALDNGAFSAWKSGKKLDIPGFQKWAEAWTKHPACDWYLIPDVIDGDESANDALLEGWPGLAVPVWHLHESIGRLERLVATYPRVALGSSGEYATVGDSAWWARMTQAMEVACDAEGMPKTKLHGLRMLDPTVFSWLPLSSADSTSVARAIGIDSAWRRGPYTPKSTGTRAAILMERIELHASAHRWRGYNWGVAAHHANKELIG